jgi:DNA invertase Pin-like site-specific DNA recombinase
MKAYGYIRVSSKGQIDGDGFARQEETIRAYADKHGVTIVQFFHEEGVSGTVDEADRPAFKEMVAAILANGVRTIIVEGLDRLAREYRVQENLLVFLASKDITLINARTEENVTEAVMGDPMKKALVQIQGVFSELEKAMLVKKLRVARERKRELTGKCEGRKSTAEIAPEVVQEIKRLHRRKPGQKRMTYQAIANRLNEAGYQTISGKPWTGYNVQKICQRF